MKKMILAFVMGALATPLSILAQPDAKKAAATADSLLQVYADKKMFTGSVLIAKNGKVLLSKGYGMADYSHGVPNSGTTKFKLASVSKQFTAMAILLLQEQGKVSTDDKLTKYIADYPQGDKITVHHLLTHTSGIVSLTSMPIYDSIRTRPVTLEQEIAYFKHQPLEFEPGTKFRYCNSGYMLLSYIIEKASGQKYGDFVKDHIFAPLGMKNSGLYKNGEVLSNVAFGYSESGSTIEYAPYIDMSIPSGAGALYSTVEDLYLWDQALYTEKLIKKATLDKMFTPALDKYAYGWMVDEFKGHKWIFHTGGIEGFSTVVNRFPEDKLCIVMLKNVDNQKLFSANKIVRCIMFGEKYELPVERKVVAVDKKVFQKLVGEYELAPGFVMAITAEEGKVFAQATGQPKLELFPEAEYSYFSTLVDALIQFDSDDKGNVSALTLLQSGMKMPGKKIR